MRLGLLGYGYMGKIRRRVLEARTDVTLDRIFHPTSCPEIEPSRLADRWEAVVDDPSLDGVFVCLPNDLTVAACTRALSLGKHVFAEKPPGRTLDEARALAEAADASEGVLQFGFNHRHHPAYRALQRRVEALGRPTWLRGVYGKSREPDFEEGWRARAQVAGGGIFLDQGIHLLDLMRDLAGGFSRVHAVGSGRPLESELMATLVSPEGTIASLHSSQSQWPARFSLDVGLEGGSVLSMEGLLSRSGRYGPETLRWRIVSGDSTKNAEGGEGVDEGEQVFEHDDSWEREVDAFIAAARGGPPITIGSPLEAVAVMSLVSRLYSCLDAAP